MIPFPLFGEWRRGSPLCQIALLLLPLLLAFGELYSQPTTTLPEPNAGSSDSSAMLSSFRLGALVGPSWNRGVLHFSVYSGSDSCGFFEGGTATHLSLGLFAEASLHSTPSLLLYSSIVFAGFSSTVLAPPRDYIARQNGEVNTVVKQHQLETSLRGWKFSIGAGWEFLRGIRVYVAPSVLLLLSGDAVQSERILQPLEAEFDTVTHSIVRPVSSGYSYAFSRLVPGVDLALAGRIDLTDRLALHPSLTGSIPFLPFEPNLSWREYTLSATLGLSWEFLPDQKRRSDSALYASSDPDRPPVVMPVLKAMIKAYGVDDKGERYNDPEIEIEETPWIESVPLIPFVFFDSTSSVIPERYRLLRSTDEAANFFVDSLLEITPLDIHWQILNVIGERMRRDSTTTVTITGTVSGDEISAGASRLGRERAEAVAEYLESIWGIDLARITTAFVARSGTASPEETWEGREENRRVELRFSNEATIDPAVIHRLATVASPPSVVFVPRFIADTTLSEWYINVVQGERELLRFEGNATTMALSQQKQWSLADLRVTRDLTPIRYRLVAKDVLGQEASDEGSFRVIERPRRRQVDSLGRAFEVLEYSIVGFPYNTADLQSSHLAQLGELAQTVPAEADITLVGYTDRVGDAERNQFLSLSRARRVQEALRLSRIRRGKVPFRQVTTAGLGNERELFNNNLPEGRMLSRMVRITVTRHAQHSE